ncbi:MULTISPECIES: GNAT family N-acetyltransferase [Amycolatopsis]|uniref:Protein N-acetyltransferase, RimJ/RimL family n=2 Tax=Amycolatopsis TaxID=1813 RepID=A0A1I3WDK4_9PSEU|nr:GNAT family N-acetyltransferase [Amycolatopsis sacchari]SFK04496.1 Protein N-acetyltransferase, RimJ/RimL family [Amycolatopsis sacchari]
MPALRSARLDLVELSEHALRLAVGRDTAGLAAELQAAVSDDWLDILPAEENLAAVREDPAASPWLSRALVLRETRELVGEAGFHHPPDELGVVELGYEVLPAHRRRGYATEAIRALTDWAYSTGDASSVYATIAADNAASIGLVRALGFRFQELYEDPLQGPLVFFERTLPLPR